MPQKRVWGATWLLKHRIASQRPRPMSARLPDRDTDDVREDTRPAWSRTSSRPSKPAPSKSVSRRCVRTCTRPPAARRWPGPNCRPTGNRVSGSPLGTCFVTNSHPRRRHSQLRPWDGPPESCAEVGYEPGLPRSTRNSENSFCVNVSSGFLQTAIVGKVTSRSLMGRRTRPFRKMFSAHVV